MRLTPGVLGRASFWTPIWEKEKQLLPFFSLLQFLLEILQKYTTINKIVH